MQDRGGTIRCHKEINIIKTRSEFKEAEEAMNALRAAEEYEVRETLKKCTWADPGDIAFYRNDKSQRNRRKILDGLVKDRRCPVCGQLKIKAKSWVVNRFATMALCRSCYVRVREVPPDQRETVSVSLYAAPIERFELNIEELTKLRTRANVSQEEFARVAGWSRSRQRDLESERVQSIGKETLESVLDTLAHFGLIVSNNPD